MYARTTVVMTVAALALVAGGCATPEQWSEWRSHSSHFASGDHAQFSLRNSPSRIQTTTADVDAARNQGGWWGRLLGTPEGQAPSALPAK